MKGYEIFFTTPQMRKKTIHVTNTIFVIISKFIDLTKKTSMQAVLPLVKNRTEM